jgi:uncharacterized protein YndB with AHSA1/START domain
MTARDTIDPKLDLTFERIVDVKPELVWRAWTQPELIKKWFTPAPWKTIACKIDLRPGGAFETTMQSPEGQEFPNIGCILEVVEGQRFVWTSAMVGGYRPVVKPENPASGLLFTAKIILEAHPQGTRYRAIAMHSVESDKKMHEEMGFEQGWGAALNQLVELCKKL